MFVPGKVRSFDETQLRAAVMRSLSWSETLRRLGMCHTGNNRLTIKKYVAQLGIDTSHFDPEAGRMRALRRPCKPIAEVLVEGSTYSRGHLKERLYNEGLKARRCEMCGQGEIWQGERMSLILDHINGVRDDNRIENLRIVCANCAATLPTHCGRVLKVPKEPRPCELCAADFLPKYAKQRFCSRECGQRAGGRMAGGRALPQLRKVERPPYEQLLEEIEATSFSAVGRKYGVSHNAVRKWLRWYELERARAEEEAA